jgi:hypothetical protein
MYQIVSDNLTGKITISDKFDITAATASADFTPTFYQEGDEYILSFIDLQNVKKFTKFFYDGLGITEGRYLLQYYRISRDGQMWSQWYDLLRNIENFPIVDSKETLYIDIKWVRKGYSKVGTIRILEYIIEGDIERDESDLSDLISIPSGSLKIISSPFIYKVFRVQSYEIISPTGIDGCELKYRYSQDNLKTWSNWELLTEGNITTTRINPIRFFQIEYSIENKTNSTVKIQDINLIGDFQNVSEDYRKSNLFGIRECCQSNMLGTYDANGNFVPNTNMNQTGSATSGGAGSGGSNCNTSSTGLPQMTTDEKAQLYNPYQQNTAVALLQKLSNDAQQLFGHQVIYFVTDADKKGQDSILHEYQLYNVVCEGDLKVSVEGNNFPDSQIVMNQFDLNLFETMEVHITKQQFKEIFGPQRRPSKEDFLYFCNLNRMYQVEHAQQFRNFNNAAVYYKLTLKKYTQKANVKADNSEIRNKIEKLTQNTTIDELFGQEDTQEKAAIANKTQFKPLTREPIRLEYNAQIDRELIENSTTIISKSHYDLSSVEYRNVAVKYRNFDPIMRENENVGYYIWFNINNYIPGEVYNFYNFYDSRNSLGYKMELVNDEIIVTLNQTTYSFYLTGSPTSDAVALEEEVWYCYVMNLDQRNKKLDQYIYKRNVDFEEEAANLGSSILRKVYHNSQDIVAHKFESEGFNPEILASDMKVTNIRLFLDVLPEEVHHKILNQYIIGEDSKYLVFADNATTRLYLPKLPLFE